VARNSGGVPQPDLPRDSEFVFFNPETGTFIKDVKQMGIISSADGEAVFRLALLRTAAFAPGSKFDSLLDG
jgi:hypothetical protein